MTVSIEMICIGDELLDGRIRDRNAAFLGDALQSRGLRLDRVTIVPDREAAIVDALQGSRAAIVVVSGGLGPTDDDRTRQAAATWIAAELETDPDALSAIRERYVSRGRPFLDNNGRQALFPAGAQVLATTVGTAPGFCVRADDQQVFFFPGVPREFQWFLAEYVLGELKADTNRATAALHFHGVPEAALADRLSTTTSLAEQGGVSIGYRADYPVIELKLSGPSGAVSSCAEEAQREAGAWLVGTADQVLPARLGARLLEQGATIATAESCTAGGIGALITDVSGSSGWFGQGFITYSNQAKMDLLGVRESVLLRHGAVSAQTVCQMASGARKASRATWAVAVSGIAGPGGGTPDKPVGTVHFGLSGPTGTYHRRVHYRLPSREMVRAGTAWTALAMVLWALEGRLDEHSVTGPYDDDDVWSEAGIEVGDV